MVILNIEKYKSLKEEITKIKNRRYSYRNEKMYRLSGKARIR